MTVERNEGEPVDYLGRIANEALEAIEAEDPNVRAVVFVENDERCMTALHGWDDDRDAIAAVIAHLAAVFEANGMTLVVAPIGGRG